MKKEYIIFEPKDEFSCGLKIIKSHDNSLIEFVHYGEYISERASCEPKHLDKIIEVLQKIKMNIKAVKDFESEFYENS